MTKYVTCLKSNALKILKTQISDSKITDIFKDLRHQASKVTDMFKDLQHQEKYVDAREAFYKAYQLEAVSSSVLKPR